MNVREIKRWASLTLLTALTSVGASEAMGKGEDGFWLVQTSVYTRHFSPDPKHNNQQQLIGLERNEGSGLLYGAATFRNSYDQQSAYGYVGKRFENADYPVYVKVSGGLMYGYRGQYRDKIPFNRFGVAPVIIPSVGVHLGPVTAEAVLLGFSATMVNVGVRF
ncbi:MULTISPECIES: sn-glycerol-3-phosphate transporter [unclassified Pseudomonas]|uniref:sn-glycerol-3-phosphate transporter n=2 Tax=unclassified Pseudomonas TaxID=196821 RepID=UPI00387E4E8F